MNILAGLSRAAGVIGALQGLVPLLGSLVQEAESLFPNTGNPTGATKLAWVQGIVKNTLAFAGQAVADVEAFIPQITATINAIVAAAKAPAQTASTPPAAPPAI